MVISQNIKPGLSKYKADLGLVPSFKFGLLLAGVEFLTLRKLMLNVVHLQKTNFAIRTVNFRQFKWVSSVYFTWHGKH